MDAGHEDRWQKGNSSMQRTFYSRLKVAFKAADTYAAHPSTTKTIITRYNRENYQGFVVGRQH